MMVETVCYTAPSVHWLRQGSLDLKARLKGKCLRGRGKAQKRRAALETATPSCKATGSSAHDALTGEGGRLVARGAKRGQGNRVNQWQEAGWSETVEDSRWEWVSAAIVYITPEWRVQRGFCPMGRKATHPTLQPG
ncbi:hypothetical protein KIL84_006341 [Mauremys mutica]|uniref:Uncharacterized protein n=1 Tax=Mauremys mutica TaxID=74926 RepID=A0A9D3X0J2_9SAUR|nr:hypothetical protein KIL84_006341 [Mauremys mutica]